ncbi:hypothetical protein SASPL_156895 [Salvia splendens]|uniref:beta-galactosidase n=1 Tax=Salvia splendens TaxID=180675 RepID=A0A8X8VVV7_SALSN|nr:hypothetical protein SASPL_156895 [Salvia splendens]
MAAVSKYFLLLLLLNSFAQLARCSVTYDRRGLVINGRRQILFSGSIHYPRSSPDMWEGLIQKAKDGGLDAIDTYVFWNLHEPSPGNYNFEGRNDLVRFVKLVQKAGMYLHLRIGPYVCAEWNFGGFPVWLKYVHGITFRTDNEPFKIENEYGLESKNFGGAGHSYMSWAAKMAVGLDTGVPWVMCKEDDAPDPVINTCNGFYCDYFSPNKPYKPTMWTEAWTGWFEEFGGPIHHRPVEDLAFAVARFIQKGGSFINYYMYHGGTNFGRTAGGPFITTSYDYDAPIDEYGLPRQPKYNHLKELHMAIKLCGHALVNADPKVTNLGNYEQHTTDCKTVAFNTGTMRSKKSLPQMLPTNVPMLSWESFNEDIFSSDGDARITVFGLLEQLNVTRDASDYLWYTTSVQISPSESFLHGGQGPVLSVNSAGHALHVFVNGKFLGSAFGTQENKKFTFSKSANFHAGVNSVALLSVNVGLPVLTRLFLSHIKNIGHRFETWSTGVLGPVTLHGLDHGTRDLSRQKWSYKVGMKGEAIDLYSPSKISSVDWMKAPLAANRQQPLTWCKAYFNAPNGNEPLALDMSSMGKGQVWINGQSIGRYWTTYAKGQCSGCRYEGTYRQEKCQDGCGKPTQRWYHVPRSWLKPTQNLLIVFEEIGGDASKISLVKRSLAYV